MLTKVQKWGNSLALRIPKSIAVDSCLSEDSTVELSLENGVIVVKPVADSAQKLAGLLSQISADNLHGEIQTDGAVGAEVW